MGFFSKPDPNKKVKVWLLVLISFVPFLCVYSFVRVRKFRKMFLINLLFLIAFVIGIYIGIGYSMPLMIHALSDLSWVFNWIILPCGDAVFVWKWSKDHNRQIDQKHLT